jgi:hypothetical protein
MEIYINGAAKTVAVETSSVPLLAADIAPTTGFYAGMQCEVATIKAVGALYMETSGADATTSSFPMAASDVISISGYQNIKNLRFIRNTTNTTLVWIPSYR